MDRIYLAYLQNKNRVEARRSYKAYLRHLGDIYKSCADSEDPNCVASYTSRPQKKAEPPKPAPVKTCDPTKDAYCLYAALVQGKSPYMPLVLPVAPAPAAVKRAPAHQSGYFYYSPSSVSFLSKVCLTLTSNPNIACPPHTGDGWTTFLKVTQSCVLCPPGAEG